MINIMNIDQVNPALTLEMCSDKGKLIKDGVGMGMGGGSGD